MTEPTAEGAAPRVDRVRLEALRYAVNDEAVSYIAIMRTFTAGLSGLLSDQSAAEVASRLTEHGIELDVDTTDARLSYLVEHGNLARSPRETEARSLRDYLVNRARYQLSQRGDLVHRQVEQLLGHSESAREVSSEMLGGILEGLAALSRLDAGRLHETEPDELSRRIGTVFAQFEQLVQSTREFYTYLTQVLSRFDLDRAEFQVFKTALLDYLQRFVDEVNRHMPQIADVVSDLMPRVPALCEHANSGQRLVDIDGRAARRGPGLDPDEWRGLRAWFAGEPGRASDADGVRRLSTEAMRALLVNLRRIAGSGDREQSRYGDLLKLARWFDAGDDDQAHALWAASFGLYSCRHLGFVADSADSPIPATASWWQAPVADVPVMLRTQGERRVAGRSGVREDFARAKAARLAERASVERRRERSLAELADLVGPGGGAAELGRVTISDDARQVLLDLYGRALAAGADGVSGRSSYGPIELSAHRTPGRGTVVRSPSGSLTLVDLTLVVGATEVAEATG